MGFKIIRIWVFESYEGLMFNSLGYVTNVHPSLYNNMDDFVQRCENKNLYIYFCLISYKQYGEDEKAWKYLNIITNKVARDYYITNAVVPFVTRYKDSPAFFAVDIMNEPEFVIKGSEGNWTTNGTSWEVMRAFISDCASAIHNIDTNILVSCGSGWHNEDNVKSGKYSGLGLDFYDYHKYSDDGYLVPYSSLNIDKPCIICECGQSSTQRDDILQDNVCKTFMNNAWYNGYAGILFWIYNYPGANSQYDFINSDSSWRLVCYSVKEFSISHCDSININGICTNKVEILYKNYEFNFQENPVKIGSVLKIFLKCKEEKPVSAFIYNLKGEKIKNLLNNKVLKKDILYEIEWKLDDDNGNKSLPGLYILYFKFGNYLPEFKTIGVIE